MKILLIGGSGFVGSVLTYELQKRGCELTNVYRNPQNSLLCGVENILVNRKDTANFQRRLHGRNYNAIIDLAAFSTKDIVATLNIPTSRYMLISSAAVYGDLEDCCIREDAAAIGKKYHQYARNKIAIEDLVRTKTDYVILRPTIVYGENDSNKKRGGFFFEQIDKSQITIPGKSSIKNNYIYVRDLVDLIICALFSTQINMTVNAGGIQFDWIEYIQALAKVCGIEPPTIQCDEMSLAEFRLHAKKTQTYFPHNVFSDFVVSNDLAKKVYNWQPNYDLYEGLKRTYWWWKSTRC